MLAYASTDDPVVLQADTCSANTHTYVSTPGMPTPPGRTVQDPGIFALLVQPVYAADRKAVGMDREGSTPHTGSVVLYDAHTPLL